jgi:poly-gamma-glutamate capsule biosynthesis protein CapA/YwtB (metallophosphatase superfamily)
MTDQQTPEPDETPDVIPTPQPQREGWVRTYIGRIVVVLYAAAAAGGALLTVLGDLDWTSTAGVITSLIALAPVLVKFLEGVQKYESANYQAALYGHQAALNNQALLAEAAAVAEVGGPRRSPQIQTPRR